jgi:nicotinate-nucleotide adenylyltransferase
MRAGRWACASCAPTSTWWRARVTSARDGAAARDFNGGGAARVGILGGTFNPPHIGHLLCAQEARHALLLDRVVLMPANVPPHKALPDDPGPERRLEMCRLACGEEGWMEVSGLEVDRGGPSYTVDTLREVHARAPGDELTFIVGGDMAATLLEWREPEAILGLATLAVAEREGVEREVLRAGLARLEGSDRVTFIDLPRVDVSSSMVRERVREGRPIRHLVPDAVVRYIEDEGLYR